MASEDGHACADPRRQRMFVRQLCGHLGLTIMRFFIIALEIALGLVIGSHSIPAAAHSPYYSRTAAIAEPGHERVSLKLLHGDGIFFADPVRAVVVDGTGNLLALSPLALALSIVCEGSDTSRTCVAYDHLSRRVFAPRREGFRKARPIEEDGQPLEYPEMLDAEFGLSERAATPVEVAAFEIKGAFRSWKATALSVAWWIAFWALILPVAQLVRSRPCRSRTVVSIALRLVGSTLMVTLTAYGWLLAPYSAFYLAAVVIAAASFTLLITRRQAIARA